MVLTRYLILNSSQLNAHETRGRQRSLCSLPLWSGRSEFAAGKGEGCNRHPWLHIRTTWDKFLKTFFKSSSVIDLKYSPGIKVFLFYVKFPRGF